MLGLLRKLRRRISVDTTAAFSAAGRRPKVTRYASDRTSATYAASSGAGVEHPWGRGARSIGHHRTARETPGGRADRFYDLSECARSHRD